MNRIIAFFTFIIIFSCSKEKNIDRKLNGSWIVTKVRIMDGEGFIYFDSIPKGNLLFDVENKSILGQVNFDFLNNSSISFKDSLTLNSLKYDLDTKLGRFYVDNNGSFYNFRILLLTRTDLQIEFYDLQKYQMKRFVFAKKE